jgi:hypothetical protein
VFLCSMDSKSASFENRKGCGTPDRTFTVKGCASYEDFIWLGMIAVTCAAQSQKKQSGQPELSGAGRFQFGGVRPSAYRCGALSAATAFVSAVTGLPGMTALLLGLTWRVR